MVPLNHLLTGMILQVVWHFEAFWSLSWFRFSKDERPEIFLITATTQLLATVPGTLLLVSSITETDDMWNVIPSKNVKTKASGGEGNKPWPQ